MRPAQGSGSAEPSRHSARPCRPAAVAISSRSCVGAAVRPPHPGAVGEPRGPLARAALRQCALAPSRATSLRACLTVTVRPARPSARCSRSRRRRGRPWRPGPGGHHARRAAAATSGRRSVRGRTRSARAGRRSSGRACRRPGRARRAGSRASAYSAGRSRPSPRSTPTSPATSAPAAPGPASAARRRPWPTSTRGRPGCRPSPGSRRTTPAGRRPPAAGRVAQQLRGRLRVEVAEPVAVVAEQQLGAEPVGVCGAEQPGHVGVRRRHRAAVAGQRHAATPRVARPCASRATRRVGGAAEDVAGRGERRGPLGPGAAAEPDGTSPAASRARVAGTRSARTPTPCHDSARSPATRSRCP